MLTILKFYYIIYILINKGGIGMEAVISRLQALTQSDSNSIVELIDLFASKFPQKGITLMALKDFAYNESSKSMNEKSILDILSQVQQTP
jgi:hypothetical protein